MFIHDRFGFECDATAALHYWSNFMFPLAVSLQFVPTRINLAAFWAVETGNHLLQNILGFKILGPISEIPRPYGKFCPN